MRLSNHPIPFELMNIIRNVFVFETTDGLPSLGLNLLLPHASSKLIVCVKGSFDLLISGNLTHLDEGSMYFSGVWTGPVRVVNEDRVLQTLVVDLQPLGANYFLWDSLSEFTNGVIDASHLRRLHFDPARVLQCEDPQKTIESLFCSLKKLSPLDKGKNDLIAASIGLIRKMKGQLRLDTLEDFTGYSKRYLHALFAQLVGISPKEFISAVRFQFMYQQLQSSMRPGYSAHIGGFFDQSHLIKDFKKKTGLPPLSLLDSQSSFTKGFFGPPSNLITF